MQRLIKLLSDINCWSIVGVLITIVTLYFTIDQHKDIDVIFSLHANKDREIDDDEQIVFILLGMDKVKDIKTTQKVKIPTPFGFYNPNRMALDIDYSVITNNIDCSMQINDSSIIKVLRKSGKLLDFYFEYDTQFLLQNNISTANAIILWSYENMSKRNSAKLNIKCIVEPKDIENNLQKGDCVIVYIPDFENSTNEEICFKILNENELIKLLPTSK